MGKSKKVKQSQESTTSNTLDPRFSATVYGNYDDAKARAAAMQPYSGELVAGFNNNQLRAQQGYLDLAAQHVGADTRNAAKVAATSAANYQPVNINPSVYTPNQAVASSVNRTDVRDVATDAVSKDAINGYLDPYLQDVVNTSMADLERQRQIQQAYGKAEAIKNSAFGGTGSAVAASLQDENFLRQMASTSANLRSQGYQSALAAAQADEARRLAAAQGNQNADLSVATTNANLAQQTNLANFGASNDAAQFNAGQNQAAQIANQAAAQTAAGLQLQASGVLGGLAGQERDAAIADADLIGKVGQQQQALEQARLDAAYQKWLQGQQLSLQEQQMINQALGLVPTQQTTNSSSFGFTKQPGNLLGDLGTAAQAAAAIMASDGRLKADVETIGHDAKGRRWVAFRYHWDDPGVTRRGVVAQEVAQTDPDAVLMHPSGFYAVDYSMLLR